jgi:outer membrane protein assembly factor BamB
MIQRVFLKSIALIFIFMFFCIGSSTNFSAPHTNITSPGDLHLSTVPGSSDPNQDEWPMFRGQLNHTGVAHTTSTVSTSPFWSYSTGGSVYSSPAVVGGRVYVGSGDGKVYCLDAITGGSIWNYTTGDSIGWSSPAVADGRVYIGSQDYKVYCLDALTGGFLWSYTTGGYVRSSPAVAGGRVYVGSSSGDAKVYCLDANTGAHLWNFSSGNKVDSSPAVWAGRVYVTGGYYWLDCLNATTGANIWSYPMAWMGSQCSPTVWNGRVYVGEYDGNIDCINATTGSLLWKLGPDNYIMSSPALADGRLYVGCYDNKIYCVDAITGAHIWNYTTGGIVYSSPAVAGGRVYVGGWDGWFYCLNSTNGKLLWRYYMYSVFSSPAVTNGRVYVGSAALVSGKGIFYCLPTDTTPPIYTSVNESADPLELGSTEIITIFGVEALSGIQTVKIEFEGDNHTMTNLGGGTWRYNTWIPSIVGNYSYVIYIQDNANMWNKTNGSIQVVETPDTTPSIPIFSLPFIIIGVLISIGFVILKRRMEF